MGGGRWDVITVASLRHLSGKGSIDDFACEGLLTDEEIRVTLANQSGRNGLRDRTTIGNHTRIRANRSS